MRSPRRSADEQYKMIMECRSSGLSDQQWCLQHDINPGTFYNWFKNSVQNSAKKCYEIPNATRQAGLTAAVKQDVVNVAILQNHPDQVHGTEWAMKFRSSSIMSLLPEPGNMTRIS